MAELLGRSQSVVCMVVGLGKREWNLHLSNFKKYSNQASSTLKVTFLTVMPAPYIQDLFRAMNADDRFDLQVLYLEQVAPDTYWGEQGMPPYAIVLPGRRIGVSGARIHFNPSVLREIAKSRTETDIVVVVGYIGITNQIVMRTLTHRLQPWLFWGEIPGFHSRGLIGRRIRAILQKPLLGAAGIAAVGSHAVDAYRKLLTSLGRVDTPIRNIPYHCRLEDFTNASMEAEDSRSNSRSVRFLYCGQLIERKGVDLLIEAFSQLVERGEDASLTLVGEGPLRESLESSLSPRVREHVTFAGFQPVDKLPQIFANADVFVLPSRHDGWGVVINQAIGAGLAIIATEAVGAANDLVKEGENGMNIPSESSEAILNALQHYVRHPEKVSNARIVSLSLAQEISMTTAVDLWYSFLKESIGDVE